MITRLLPNGKEVQVRPSFKFHAQGDGTNWGWEQITAEPSEDIRDNLEGLNRKQTLQCDVAGAIKAMARDARATRRAIERLAAKLAPTPREKARRMAGGRAAR